MDGSAQLAPVTLKAGDKIMNLYEIKERIAEGSYGIVFVVENVKDHTKAAMKVEPRMKRKENEVLKMEVFILRKLQKSKHACKILMASKESNYSFVVMTLLGRELNTIRRSLPGRKISLGSSMKIGVQMLEAIRDVHDVGFVHRDIKPANFALGLNDVNLVYIIDFGLARMMRIPDSSGMLRMRAARLKVPFRGTIRYCSLNAHLYLEQGRQDDLISMMYVLIELITGLLPWKGLPIGRCKSVKQNVDSKVLFAGCPNSFFEINRHLNNLTYYDEPDYDLIKRRFIDELNKLHAKPSDPLDFNSGKIDFKKGSQEGSIQGHPSGSGACSSESFSSRGSQFVEKENTLEDVKEESL